MTIPVQRSRKLISGSGWANPLTHDFPIENATDVEVYADSVKLTLGTHYTVSGVGSPSGYSVAIIGGWAPTVWALNVLYPINQPSDVDQGGQFGARFEAAIDRMARSDQVIAERAYRSVVVPASTPLDVEIQMPLPEDGHYLGWVSGKLANRPDTETSSVAAEGWAAVAQAAANGNLVFPSRLNAGVALIDVGIHSITLKGWDSEGDGLGGLYIDADNGSTSTFTSADGRTWYRVRDTGRNNLSFDVLSEVSSARGPDMSHWAAIKARILAGTARIAVLGDSTEAGIGNEGGAGSGVAYGECRPLNHAAAWNMAFYSMIRAIPGFIPLPDKASAPAWGPFEPVSSTLYVPIKHWRFVISDATPAQFTHVQRQRVARDKLYVYVLERTAAEAGTFRLRVTDGAAVTYASQTIDTYADAPVFGSVGAVDVGGRIKCVEITLSDAPREFTVVLDNFSLRSGASAGTIVVLGFSMGAAVHFRNLAISSTTLLNTSAANTTRGITTANRLSAAAAFGANIYVIGFGTNDSKVGVSTPAAFRADLLNRVNTLLGSGNLVILETAPRGETGSQYANNPIFNQMAREVASITGCALLDREKMFEVDRANLLSDEVHPNEMGYTALAEAYCQAIGIPSYWSEGSSLQMAGSATGGMEKVRGLNDATGGFVNVIERVIERPADCRNITIMAKINLADTANIIASAFELELQPAGGGAASLDTCIVSAPVVSGTALTTAYLVAQYTFNTSYYTRYSVRVKGKNFRLRSGTDGWSTLAWQFH